MTYKIAITAGAESDLDGIFAYIVQDNPRAAGKMVKRLYEKISTLKTMPKRCPLAPENGVLDLKEVRHLIYSNYRIIFCIENKTVTILEIRHGSRLLAD